MRINRENYESFLVDYAEGILSAALMQEVKSFLLLNPDIQEEFDLFNNEVVENITIRFDAKERLKKIPFQKTTVSSDYFQQLCVAHIEGLLSKKERAFLVELTKEDELKKRELQLFEKTKLIVDNLNFNEKLLLKQPEIIHNITDTNIEEYCVACIEGWLDQKGLVALNSFIAANPKYKKTIDIYNKTRLTPDLSIVYPDKRTIKRFSVLSPSFKKVVSLVASAAAIVVFGFMVFYSSTLNNTSHLTSNVSSPIIHENTIDSNREETDTSETQENKTIEKKSKIFHDPFGFTKISGTQEQITKANTERINVNPIKPIGVSQIECLPCKQLFEDRTMILKASNNHQNLKANNENNQRTHENISDNSKVWQIAQAGITGINKFTNAELSVQKDESMKKTKIEFQSKYFSFSTNVNRKN